MNIRVPSLVKLCNFVVQVMTYYPSNRSRKFMKNTAVSSDSCRTLTWSPLSRSSEHQTF